MVPGWFRAFRLRLVDGDKVTLRASPTASAGSERLWDGSVCFAQSQSTAISLHFVCSPRLPPVPPWWLHAFRLEPTHVALRPQLPLVAPERPCVFRRRASASACPQCAEVVMLRALPQVAELLLPSPSEERWAETEGVWLEPARLYKQHLEFFYQN